MELPFPEETVDTENREHLRRLGEGAVLLARDALQDPNFMAAVVLICIYGKDGGIIFGCCVDPFDLFRWYAGGCGQPLSSRGHSIPAAGRDQRLSGVA